MAVVTVVRWCHAGKCQDCLGTYIYEWNTYQTCRFFCSTIGSCLSSSNQQILAGHSSISSNPIQHPYYIVYSSYFFLVCSCFQNKHFIYLPFILSIIFFFALFFFYVAIGVLGLNTQDMIKSKQCASRALHLDVYVVQFISPGQLFSIQVHLFVYISLSPIIGPHVARSSPNGMVGPLKIPQPSRRPCSKFI